MIHEGLAGGSNALFAVFDGHGTEGEKCSRHVASHLPSMPRALSQLQGMSFPVLPGLCCCASDITDICLQVYLPVSSG